MHDRTKHLARIRTVVVNLRSDDPIGCFVKIRAFQGFDLDERGPHISFTNSLGTFIKTSSAAGLDTEMV
jgi:hypothetical protein